MLFTMQAARGWLAQFHAKKSYSGGNILLPACMEKKKSIFFLPGELKINVSFYCLGLSYSKTWAKISAGVKQYSCSGWRVLQPAEPDGVYFLFYQIKGYLHLTPNLTKRFANRSIKDDKSHAYSHLLLSNKSGLCCQHSTPRLKLTPRPVLFPAR